MTADQLAGLHRTVQANRPPESHLQGFAWSGHLPDLIRWARGSVKGQWQYNLEASWNALGHTMGFNLSETSYAGAYFLQRIWRDTLEERRPQWDYPSQGVLDDKLDRTLRHILGPRVTREPTQREKSFKYLTTLKDVGTGLGLQLSLPDLDSPGLVLEAMGSCKEMVAKARVRGTVPEFMVDVTFPGRVRPVVHFKG